VVVLSVGLVYITNQVKNKVNEKANEALTQLRDKFAKMANIKQPNKDGSVTYYSKETITIPEQTHYTNIVAKSTAVVFIEVSTTQNSNPIQVFKAMKTEVRSSNRFHRILHMFNKVRVNVK